MAWRGTAWRGGACPGVAAQHKASIYAPSAMRSERISVGIETAARPREARLVQVWRDMAGQDKARTDSSGQRIERCITRCRQASPWLGAAGQDSSEHVWAWLDAALRVSAGHGVARQDKDS